MKLAKLFLFPTLFIVCVVYSSANFRVFAQTLDNQSVTNIAERESGDRFTISAKTRKGANVYAVSTQPSPDMLGAIDKGLDDLFAIARKHDYNRRLKHSDYTIYIALSDRQKDSDGNYSPDIAISAGQYGGSIYDQGGYIYAAGMVIAFKPCAFIIAEHDKNWNRVSDVVRYEGEHLVLYHNDRRLYKETADHSKSGGHPILN
jgi:hypothetical protein